jgi:parallel beta-helix repeat protein
MKQIKSIGKGLAALSLFCAFLISATAPVLADAVDDLITQGKQAIFKDMAIAAAHEKFHSALSLIDDSDPRWQKVNFWLAVTVIADNEDLLAELRSLKMLDASNVLSMMDKEGAPNYNTTSAVDNIILDEGAAATSPSWTTRAEDYSFDPYDGECLYHEAPTSATATWTPTIPAEGYYNAYVWIPKSPDNVTDAKYTFSDIGYGSKTITINQNDDSFYTDWYALGSFYYYFPFGTERTITLSDGSSTGYTICDAIKLEYVGYILNDDADEVSFSPSGEWEPVTEEPDALNDDYHLHSGGNGSATATWTITIGSGEVGEYFVFAQWPRIQDAAPTIRYAVNGNVIEINNPPKASIGGEWYCLGAFQFTAGANTVVLYASSQAGEKVAADGIKTVPAKMYPNLTESQSLDTGLLPQLNEALGYMAEVDSTAFEDTITNDDSPMTGGAVTIDYGDAKALEAAIYAVKADVRMESGSNMANADVRPFMLNGDMSGTNSVYAFLDRYPALGTPMEGANLSDVPAILTTAIDRYSTASAFIRSRPDDDGKNHFIKIYDSDYDQEEKDEALLDEARLRDVFADIRENLNGTGHPYFTIAAGCISHDAPDINVDTDAYLMLTSSSPINIRSYLDQLREHRDIVYDSVGDNAKLGGILPNFTPATWNHIYSVGPDLVDEARVVWSGSTPSVRIDWDISKDAYKSNLDTNAFEVYRSTTPDVANIPENKVNVTIEQIATDIFRVTDNTIDGLSDVYYYHVYSHYTFGDGTAATYAVAKAVLRIYVDGSVARYGGKGTKADPCKSLKSAIRERASNGTRVCVAKGTYYNRDIGSSVPLWNRNGIILEGGYDPQNDWSRNYEANITTLDASDYNGWACIDIWNVGDVVIDGFTITGAIGQQYSSGINIGGNASSTVIRNCKITNCNCGISVGDGASSVRIENCVIEGRKVLNAGDRGVGFWRALNSEIDNCVIKDFNTTGINVDTSSVTITNSSITGNKATAINVFNSSTLTLTGSTVSDNDSVGIGSSSNSTVSITGSTISGNDNSAISAGGTTLTLTNSTVSNNGGGVSVWSNSNATVTNCSITGNGDGISMDSSTLTVKDCAITNNTYKGLNIFGGSSAFASIVGCDIAGNGERGIYLQVASGSVVNNLIRSNSNDGIYCWGGSANFSIINNTIVNNGGAGGIYYSNVGSITVKNNIIASNNGGYGKYGIYCGSGSKGTITHNNAYGNTNGNTNGNYYNCGTDAGSDNNISEDPKFVNPSDHDGADDALRTADDGFSIKSDSPSRDTGDNSAIPEGVATDFAGNSRISNSVVDMGAYELSGNEYKNDIIIDFGDPYGIWIRYNNSDWSHLHPASPESITTADMDGNGKDDVVIDFGTEHGIWIRYNNSDWSKLHPISPESIAAGDLDGNGKDDLIIDFGDPYGIWIRYNNSDWSPLHPFSPETMTTGDIDGE